MLPDALAARPEQALCIFVVESFKRAEFDDTFVILDFDWDGKIIWFVLRTEPHSEVSKIHGVEFIIQAEFYGTHAFLDYDKGGQIQRSFVY